MDNSWYWCFCVLWSLLKGTSPAQSSWCLLWYRTPSFSTPPSFWKKGHWFSLTVLDPAAGNRHKLTRVPSSSPAHQYANSWTPYGDAFQAGKRLFSSYSKKVNNFSVAKMIFLSLLLYLSLLFCSLCFLLGSPSFSLLSTAPGLVKLNRYCALCC